MKIGQTIKCLNSVGSGFLHRDYFYEVIDVNQHGNIRVQCQGSGEKSTHYYKTNRFVLVKEKVVAPAIVLNKTYTTRKGEKVKLYTVTSEEERYPVVGVVLDKDSGKWCNVQWTKQGHYFQDDINDWDLVEAPNEIEFKTSVKNIKVQIFRDESALLTQGVDDITINGQALKEIVAGYKKMHGEKSLD